MKKHILVVDDDSNIQELLSTYLGRAGFEVIRSSDGKDALKQCVTKRPHLILMDWKMPELDGLNALDLIKLADLGRNTPIVMMSGNAGTEIIENAKRLGAKDFLIKPFNPAELLEKIEKLLGLTPSQVPSANVGATAAPVAATVSPAPTPAPTASVKTPVPVAVATTAPTMATASDSASPPAAATSAPPTAVAAEPAVKESPQPIPEPTQEKPSMTSRALDALMHKPASKPIRPASLADAPATPGESREKTLQAIEHFIAHSQELLLSAQIAIRESRALEVVKIASSLKNDSAKIGAVVFSNLCGDLEKMGRTGVLTDGLALLKNLREEYKRCKQALEEAKAQPPK